MSPTEKAIKCCNKCDLTFIEDIELKTHMADHSSIETQTKQREFDMINYGIAVEKKMFLCDICQKVFDKENLFKNPFEANHQIKSNEIDNNIIGNQKQSTLKCNECQLEFTGDAAWKNLQNLTKHKRSKHEKNTESDMKINCDECDFTSKGLNDLKRHHRDVHKQLTESTSPLPKNVEKAVSRKQTV